MRITTGARSRKPLVFEDGFLSLDELATYGGQSKRQLQDYLTDPMHPLPHYRFGKRVLVKRSEYDEWALQYRVQKEAVDIKALVDAKIAGR